MSATLGATPTIVLVGHGMVGQRFLEALAERGLTATHRVVVLCEEPRPAYDRVALTSYFAGKTPEDLSMTDMEFIETHGIELFVGDPAETIDREAKKVTARSGQVFEYDILVLATGSFPFVPPVPNKDAAGCFVYRTIEDLLAIEEYAKTAEVGAVVGGGLLGLEAAGALKGLGLTSHIVEFAPRLMPVQVDDGGGAALLRTIEDMGLSVHTGVGTQEIVVGEDGAVTGMKLSDGSELATDMVVFSAGVRPRDQLARDCGLTVGERGGISVDEQCRTVNDPHVFAIGECALASDGRVYGLVAPGYEQAETAAATIAADEAAFTGADMSTKLKLLGVDVASFGDAHGATADCLDVVYSDSRSGIYKKLVIGRDGELLGGILVGDADAYGTLKAFTGSVPPVSPESLVLPAGSGGGAQLGPTALPDDAIICSCHNVSKGAIRGAVTDHQCTTVPEVKKCTKAGTGCGSCVKVLGQLVTAELEASGVEVDKGLCGCFSQTREELYEIVLALRINTYQGLLDRYGRDEAKGGDGCEICKPAVGSIIASLAPTIGASGYVLEGEQAALQDSNDHFLANLQKNGSYSVVPRIPGGEITPEGLIVIGEIARDFGLYTKITGGQRIDMFGARVEQLPVIWTRLVDAGFESGHAYGKSLRTVKSCVGQTWCRYGVQDSVRMAIDLELRYRGLRSPHKLKSAVSGCARECAEAQSKDFGVIATSNGWNLYVGGNGGATPRHADLLAQDLDDAQLIKLIDRFLMFYIRTADRLERTSTWLERIPGGLDHVRDVVVEDSLGICEELESLMADHVSHYADEWASTINDPEKLARFVSFVNAPDTPDPVVGFVPERDQIKPDLPLLSIGLRPADVLEGSAQR
ncbi:nitrite reductase large subunit NirB [Streptomyces sp. NPDC014892]|uniref:nitrite reductase large subunit NirB n=1 Tax=Streptomyces TaxID=1883 RepID=UPI001EFAC103|nr:nitrite reductase large subunit NirB [Streptomyces deccanensis]ULR50488.1 nitrite reductase large subunit NirB [Streptomyces deccanensis]